MRSSTAAPRPAPHRQLAPTRTVGQASALSGRHRGRHLLRRLVILSVALQVALLVNFRLRVPWLLNQVRAFNKRFFNPAMLTVAGRRLWYASIVRHVGRRTGRSYVTPVVTEPTSDGFLIPLPYGAEVDWARNVLAAGRGTIKWRGSEYSVAEPELIDRAAALPALPLSRQLAFRLYGVKHLLKVTKVSQPGEAGPGRRDAS